MTNNRCIYSDYLKEQYPDLPEGWCVYSFQLLPRGADTFTHAQLKGAVPRPLKSGKRKGQLTWRDAHHERCYIVALEDLQEYEQSYLQSK